MNAIKERNLNLDLIRFVALLMVPCLHGFDHTGLYSSALNTIPGGIMMVGKMLITCSIPLYLLLSGYLCSKKAPCGAFLFGIVPHIFILTDAYR